jgi:predicted GIY-YIG superfamily endonuclease
MKWDAKTVEQWTLDLEGDQWRGAFVYVARQSPRGRPLYVGKTTGLRQRIARHLSYAGWRNEVRSFDFYRFATAEEATAAESAAIRDLNPIHNIRRIRYLGAPTTVDELSADQLRIVRRVQDRTAPEPW